MKNYYTLLLALLVTTISFAQGISVQGIARDNASAAITQTTLTFTFSITKDDNTVLYAETQNIKTDDFGVFSHVLRSGNPITNTFDAIDFSIDNLKLKASVNYNSEEIEIYNQTLQYTPYAHYAKNAGASKDGVPTGSIMPYAGTTAPSGWVMCKGQSIASLDGGAALRAIVGNNAPNLQGMFLRGTGTSPVNSKAGPALRSTQGDLYKSHGHIVNARTVYTSEAGDHKHGFENGSADHDGGGYVTAGYDGNQSIDKQSTKSAGKHTHSVYISAAWTASSGSTETRPVNYGVNYIIKL